MAMTLDSKTSNSDDDRSQQLWQLANELLVVSALLDMLTARRFTQKELNEPSMLDMCTSSNLRCQSLVDQLLQIELQSSGLAT